MNGKPTQMSATLVLTVIMVWIGHMGCAVNSTGAPSNGTDVITGSGVGNDTTISGVTAAPVGSGAVQLSVTSAAPQAIHSENESKYLFIVLAIFVVICVVLGIAVVMVVAAQPTPQPTPPPILRVFNEGETKKFALSIANMGQTAGGVRIREFMQGLEIKQRDNFAEEEGVVQVNKVLPERMVTTFLLLCADRSKAQVGRGFDRWWGGAEINKDLFKA